MRRFRPPSSASYLAQRPRPQLPFLANPRRPLARFLTTETKQWIKYEFVLAGKITIFFWTSAVLLFMVAYGLQQEWLNHRFPSPDEWTWLTRKDFRSVKWEADVDGERNGLVDWAIVGMQYKRTVKRLEDPDLDGAGLVEQEAAGTLAEGEGGRVGFDLSNKSEPWRRGYYEILMGLGKAAEHLEGWVQDRTTKTCFPANVVIGPSNPNPRPVPAGARAAPREELCDIYFDSPRLFYTQILTTKGFTDKQRIDAAITYAVYLDFKKLPDEAFQMYKLALDIAAPNLRTANPEVHPVTHIINTNAGPPSANVLSVVTALAVHQAANANLSVALPMFLSILRARKSLSDVPSTMLSTLISDDEQKRNAGFFTKANDFFNLLVVPPKYPPPPPDGHSPPLRTAKETCEEAGVMNYIGEILYASKSSRKGQEDGLAWTREAVDIAEEQLRKGGIDDEGKQTCAQCLEVGMGNWAEMVKQLCEKEKREKKEKIEKGNDGWLSFGGKKVVGEEEHWKGRWESEEMVVEERLRRARDVLDSARHVPPSFWSFLW